MSEPQDDSLNMVDSFPMEVESFEPSQRELSSMRQVPLSELSPGQINCLDPYHTGKNVRTCLVLICPQLLIITHCEI